MLAAWAHCSINCACMQVDRGQVHNLTRPHEIVDVLKNVSSSQIADMQASMAQHLRYFDYRAEPTSPPSAAQLPLDAACRCTYQ